MRRFLAVLTRELKAYFDSIVAYVILLAFFLFTTWYTLTNLDAMGQASLRAFFGFLPVGFIVFVPALAMRLWSEERKLGTIEVLLTWPLRHVDLVLGKNSDQVRQTQLRQQRPDGRVRRQRRCYRRRRHIKQFSSSAVDGVLPDGLPTRTGHGRASLGLR